MQGWWVGQVGGAHLTPEEALRSRHTRRITLHASRTPRKYCAATRAHMGHVPATL